MGVIIDYKEAHDQSTATYLRQKALWFDMATRNKKNFKSLPSIEGIAEGRKLILFAFGPSFEKNIKQIKQNKLHYEYDIMCVDKAFGKCLENGVIPKYVFTADSRLPVEECLGKSFNPLICKSVTLLCAITCNNSWTDLWAANGGNIYFFTNKDTVRSHKDLKAVFNYSEESGTRESVLIPAATNVANSAYVVASIIMSYSEILLAAFDYSFTMNGNYYGSADTKTIDRIYSVDKRSLYNHITLLDINGRPVQTSQNMLFSCKWLMGFVQVVQKEKGTVTINITGGGILSIPNQAIIRVKEA